MFRFFDMIGRSTAMRALDEALRAAGMHPMLVPEPVKLTMLRLTRDRAASGSQAAVLAQAAELLAYCSLGHAQFADSTSAADAEAADQRFEQALEHGDTLDAKLILLALHSGLVATDIADRIDSVEIEAPSQDHDS